MGNLKLNKKGFTLIELLAVIVILAIIMVVTIPTVLNSMNRARTNQLQNAADSVSEWFTKEYELAAMGDFAGGADAAFNTYVSSLKKDTDGKKIGTYQTLNSSESTENYKLDPNVLTAGGISNAATNIDVNNSYVYYNTKNSRICVVLKAQSGGSFYVNTDGATNKACSSGCNNSDCSSSS